MGESIFHWEDGPPWVKMHPNWCSNMPRIKYDLSDFFTFTFKAVGVTFLKVIFQFTEKVQIWLFWISLAVISYLLPPVFLTPLPPLSVIAWKILVQNKVAALLVDAPKHDVGRVQSIQKWQRYARCAIEG